jgi:hypothetical protein
MPPKRRALPETDAKALLWAAVAAVTDCPASRLGAAAGRGGQTRPDRNSAAAASDGNTSEMPCVCKQYICTQKIEQC